MQIKVADSTLDDIQRSQAQYAAAARAIAPDGGLPALMQAAVAQLGRFVAANIEVDTGRTKASIFERVTASRNGVTGMLGTQVHYAPYVRDRGHRLQFFDHARQVEGPAALRMLGQSVVLKVEKAFN